MKYLSLALVRFYQRRISPMKGYRCAHGAYHGGLSCSCFCAKQIEEHGVLKAVLSMPLRFRACHEAARLMTEEKDSKKPKKKDGPDRQTEPHVACMLAEVFSYIVCCAAN